MAAVEACRCIRAIVHKNPGTQQTAIFSSTIEALIHAIADGSTCLCAHAACLTLQAICAGNQPAQVHAHRCGAIAILLRVLHRRDACASAAAAVLASIVAHGSAAEAAVQAGAFEVLMPLLKAPVANICVLGRPAAAAGVAQALSTLVEGSALLADAFEASGGLERLEAMVFSLNKAATARADLALSANGPDCISSGEAITTHKREDTGQRNVSPHTSGDSDLGNDVGMWCWKLVSSEHAVGAAAGMPEGLITDNVQLLSRLKMTPHWVTSYDAKPRYEVASGADKAARPLQLARMQLLPVPELLQMGIQDVCRLLAALSSASVAVQARLRATTVLPHLVWPLPSA
jgi:hypothetical protein